MLLTVPPYTPDDRPEVRKSLMIATEIHFKNSNCNNCNEFTMTNKMTNKDYYKGMLCKLYIYYILYFVSYIYSYIFVKLFS